MIRTFHPQISPLALILCLLPCTGMAVYAFWMKQILIGLAAVVLIVLYIERTIHSVYTLTDDGQLTISYGRFSKDKVLSVHDIARIEIFRPSRLVALWQTDWVLLVLNNGSHLVLQPNPAESFCRAILGAQKSEETTREVEE